VNVDGRMRGERRTRVEESTQPAASKENGDAGIRRGSNERHMLILLIMYLGRYPSTPRAMIFSVYTVLYSLAAMKSPATARGETMVSNRVTSVARLAGCGRSSSCIYANLGRPGRVLVRQSSRHRPKYFCITGLPAPPALFSGVHNTRDNNKSHQISHLSLPGNAKTSKSSV
jgi:hypothetical protein